MKLGQAQLVTGWKRQHGGITTSQKWRLEGSMTNGNFKELCPQTHFDTSNTWQPCSGAKVLYVRMVKAQALAPRLGRWSDTICC